jgi:hypothetical protein
MYTLRSDIAATVLKGVIVSNIYPCMFELELL